MKLGAHGGRGLRLDEVVEITVGRPALRVAASSEVGSGSFTEADAGGAGRTNSGGKGAEASSGC